MNQCCKFNVLWWKSKKNRYFFRSGMIAERLRWWFTRRMPMTMSVRMALLTRWRAASPRLKKMLADGGYKGRKLADTVRQKLGAEFTVVLRPDESPKKFSVLPLRCIVERSFSWLENFRRIAIDHEFYSDTGEAMVQLAFCRLMYNKLCDWNLNSFLLRHALSVLSFALKLYAL